MGLLLLLLLLLHRRRRYDRLWRPHRVAPTLLEVTKNGIARRRMRKPHDEHRARMLANAIPEVANCISWACARDEATNRPLAGIAHRGTAEPDLVPVSALLRADMPACGIIVTAA